jgi:sugar phosphate isomerase/epimerase
MTSTRRQFVQFVTASAAGLAMTSRWPTSQGWADTATRPLELGIDNFAVRAMGWKAKDLIDYAAQQHVDALFITDLDAFESLEPAALAAVKDQADEKQVKLYVGTWSICPTSVTFKDKWGSAQEHLALGLRVAHALGSPVIRVVLGSRDDRRTEGGIRARIADTVRVLKSQQSLAADLGVRVAVENHAGDMHSLELVDLVEAAGKDYVGVNLDAGNAVWTLEDPLENLKNLAPYVLTTSLRDSVAWKSDRGVTVQWTAMGAGMVDWKAYFEYFAQHCPDAPVNIETISGFNHELPVNDAQYWQENWGGTKPKGYEQFLEFAARGTALEPHRIEGGDRQKQEQAYQKSELERSLEFCKSIGLCRTRQAS